MVIENIVLHCSDSSFGTALEIDKWHKARGWDRIGYMGVILNGFIAKNVSWHLSDGAWEWGRVLNQDYNIEPWEKEAHAFGINNKSVGICLIGTTKFTANQFNTANRMITYLCKIWDLPYSSVIGHYEVDKNKTCPNLDMDLFRQLLYDGDVTKLRKE